MGFARRSPVAGEFIGDVHRSLAKPIGIVVAEIVDWKYLALSGLYTVAFIFSGSGPWRA